MLYYKYPPALHNNRVKSAVGIHSNNQYKFIRSSKNLSVDVIVFVCSCAIDALGIDRSQAACAIGIDCSQAVCAIGINFGPWRYIDDMYPWYQLSVYRQEGLVRSAARVNR